MMSKFFADGEVSMTMSVNFVLTMLKFRGVDVAPPAIRRLGRVPALVGGDESVPIRLARVLARSRGGQVLEEQAAELQRR